MIIVRIIQVLAVLFTVSMIAWGVRMTVYSENMLSGATDNDTGFQFEMPKMPWFLRQVTQQNPDVPLEKGVIRRIPTDIGGAVQGKRNELLFRPDDLNVTRSIKIEQVLPFSAFLNEDEEMPSEDIKILYVRTRAARVLAPYCREMLGVLAKGCAYKSTQVTEGKDGTYRVGVTFVYVPAYDLGAFKVQQGYEELSAIVNLTPQRTFGIINSPEARAAVYRKALKACDEFRKLYPNCVLERMYFTIVPKQERKSTRSKRKKAPEKKKSLLKRAKRFGEKGAFGSKAGFGKKSKTKKPYKIEATTDFRYTNETFRAHAVLGVYAIDTEDENTAVRELGKAVSEKLMQ